MAESIYGSIEEAPEITLLTARVDAGDVGHAACAKKFADTTRRE